MKNLIVILFALMFIVNIGFSQKTEKKQTENKIKAKQEISHNLQIIEKNDLYGFINSNGVEIVKPQYVSIGKFGEYKSDWALVQKGDMYGFINSNGVEVVKPQYVSIGKFGEYKPDWALVQKGDLYGFINSKGVEVVKPKFVSIEAIKM